MYLLREDWINKLCHNANLGVCVYVCVQTHRSMNLSWNGWRWWWGMAVVC